MNIFVLDTDPTVAAHMHCDKHVPKMVVEAAQMMASALRRHGATDEQSCQSPKRASPTRAATLTTHAQCGLVTVVLTFGGWRHMPKHCTVPTN